MRFAINLKINGYAVTIIAFTIDILLFEGYWETKGEKDCM